MNAQQPAQLRGNDQMTYRMCCTNGCGAAAVCVLVEAANGAGVYLVHHFTVTLACPYHMIHVIYIYFGQLTRA